MHHHPHWLLAILAFAGSLACAAYVIHDIKRDRKDDDK